MIQQPTTYNTHAQPTAHDEQILVVQRELLFHDGAWSGLKSDDMDRYKTVVIQHGEFKPRSAMESDTRYKQIIPYLIFEYRQHYFLMQRRHNASEARLQNKFSLGIGGHIRQEDMIGKNIFDWATREFHEEVNYTGTLDIEPLGLINDDSNSVGQVHVGFVLLLHGNSETISIKAEHKSGSLVSESTMGTYIESMESWSQIVWRFISNRK
jgi:predicted NUDIX family phosphoesterase